MSSRLRLALLKVWFDVLVMGLATAGLVHAEGWVRALCVWWLAATFYWFRRDWPELRGYLVEQRDREQ